MVLEEDVAAGLLNWISSLDVSESVNTIDDLVNKDVLWQALQLIDEVAFPGPLPEDPARIDASSRDSWIPRWNNLKHIYDALSMFLIEDCGQRLPIFHTSSSRRGNPDLKAIAQYSSLPDTIILLKLCVVAATNCAERITFLQQMQNLGESTQKVLMETLQEAQEALESEGEEDDTANDIYESEHIHSPRSPISPARGVEQGASKPLTDAAGSELAFEERLAKVIADNQRIAHEKRDLQRHFDDFQARYDSLAERHDRTQEELAESNDRLAAVLSGRSAEGGKEAKNEQVIASLEARVGEAEAETEELRRNNEILKLKADKAQKLQDDYDEIKIERDKLSRKANAAEKYRVKLEQTQDMEKENNQLKNKVTELQAQLRQSDTRTASSSDLAREVDEYRRLLPTLEQERHEVNEMKKRLEFDYHMLQARYADGEEQLRKSKAEIEDLQGRLREYDEGAVPPATMDRELEENSDTVDKALDTDEADFAAAEARLTEALLKSSTAVEIPEITEGEPVPLPIEADEGISEDELRAIMAAMRAQMQAGTESGVKVQKKLVVMLEKIRSKNESLVEHIKKQTELISTLQANGATANGNEPKEPKTESELEQQVEDQEQLIKNMRREIKLMTSAWYEQNQRMATLGNASGSGAVALMRMKASHGNNGFSSGNAELPRSWLGRQRVGLDRAVLRTDDGGGGGRTS